MSMTFIRYFYYHYGAYEGDKINIHGRTIDDDRTRAASELFEWLENPFHRHHESTKRSKILKSFCFAFRFFKFYPGEEKEGRLVLLIQMQKFYRCHVQDWLPQRTGFARRP